MTEAKHTPGPWTIWPDADSDQLAVGPERGGVAICDVVITNGIGVNTESTRATGYANADFIVRACNNHDDLLAALMDAEAVLMGLRDSGGELAIASYPALVSVRAAIAKAEVTQ